MGDIGTFADKITEGYRLDYDEAIALVNESRCAELCSLAGLLRERFNGKIFDTCSIMNARSGRCPEDCKWCSQSKYHKTDIDIYPLAEEEQALEMARHNAAKGVRRFSLVTSGRAMSDKETEQVCRIYKKLGKEVGIELCASMGLLSKSQLQSLRDSGVRRYHCNLETAPSYFPQLCTTHTTQDKIKTIEYARQAGMEICSGGIIGMGETMEQRIEMAFALRELGVVSIPLNVLNPIRGTALENARPLDDEQVLKSFAMFRIVNPRAHIRFAGGRTLIKRLERKLLRSGVSASIVGDMLTTSGSDISSDMKMFTEEGFFV